MSSALQIFEDAAADIRDLQRRVESDSLLMQNLTVRLAIHQLRHGVIDYKNAGPEWGAILELMAAGKVVLASSGEVYLYMKLLTAGLLAEETINLKADKC